MQCLCWGGEIKQAASFFLLVRVFASIIYVHFVVVGSEDDMIRDAEAVHEFGLVVGRVFVKSYSGLRRSRSTRRRSSVKGMKRGVAACFSGWSRLRRARVMPGRCAAMRSNGKRMMKGVL